MVIYFPDDLTLNDLTEARKQMDGYVTKIYDNGNRINTSRYLTDELSINAVKFIEDNSNNPFFLYLSYNRSTIHLCRLKKKIYLEIFI